MGSCSSAECAEKRYLKDTYPTHSKVVVKQLDPTHPAYDEGNGRGLFATETIEKGETIGEYTGRLYIRDERDENS